MKSSPSASTPAPSRPLKRKVGYQVETEAADKKMRGEAAEADVSSGVGKMSLDS